MHLTPAGREQVRSSVASVLAGVQPDVVCTSEAPWAVDTAMVALGVLAPEKEGITFFSDVGFGVDRSEALYGHLWPYAEVRKLIQEQEQVYRAAGKVLTVSHVLRLWPTAAWLAGQLDATMRGHAERWWLGQTDPHAEVVALVGTHGHHVYATLDPANTPGTPGYASIMEYRYELDEDRNATLVASALLSPGVTS